MGLWLIPRLLKRGHEVRALIRPGSEKKLVKGCTPVLGNALDGRSYAGKIAPCDTFIQLVGVAHPSPAKGDEFRRIDLPSGLGAVAAAREAGVKHFVYLSVAQPAPMMKAYIEVRAECEKAIRDAGLNATVLRPWYVLGPGHRRPYLLLDPQDPGRRSSARISHTGTDDKYVGSGRRSSGRGSACRDCPGDSGIPGVSFDQPQAESWQVFTRPKTLR